MTFNTGLSRDGPALLVRDLMRDDAVTDTTLGRIVAAAPDVAVLQSVDYDHDHVALGLIRDRLNALGLDLPYTFALRPNTGVDSGHDLDRNGKLAEPRDMQGYGRFAGQGGMAVLSRLPILPDQSHDLSGVVWVDQPEPGLPVSGDQPFFDGAILSVLRLHSVAAWDVAVQTPDGVLRLLTSHASTPVFDGPEDRNGLRNAAELRFWAHYIEGLLPDARFVLLGDFNNDPDAGEGQKPALRALLGNPRLKDPKPRHSNGMFTAEWDGGLRLRVDYVLPSSGLGVAAAQIEWTPLTDEGARHHPVWADVVWK